MSKLAYPIVGGPLHGQHAITKDFRPAMRKINRLAYFGDPLSDAARVEYEDIPPGRYARYRNEYIAYNCGHAAPKQAGRGVPSMIFVHKSVLAPTKRPADR
jgi:hypothetical protein